MSDHGVRYAVHEGVGRIALARPESSNAIDLDMSRALGDAVTRAASDDAVRAVLVLGEGKRFCAGGDVASMAKAPDQPTYLRELASHLERVLRRLSELPKPVVAAVHGAVAGAGLAVMLNADIIVAARNTSFLMAYAGVGLTPDCGISYLLPRAIGQQRALELALTGRVLTATEALAWGLVTEVAEGDSALTRAEEIAGRLASGPSFAYAQAKRLSRASWAVSREHSAEDEASTIAEAVATNDARDLISKFTSSRA